MTPQAWNAFVEEHGPQSGAFLQSWEWGEVLRAQGRVAQRETLVRGGAVRAVALWEQVRLPLGFRYRYMARGPIASSADDALAMCKRLVARAALSSELFLRCDLVQETDARVWEAHARREAREVQPSVTLITDVTRSDDALLAAMHQKTRYNIRVAQRHGVEVAMHGSDDAEAMETFLALYATTAQRHGVRLSTAAHIRAIVAQLHGRDGAPRAFLASARLSDETLAMALCVDFAGTRTYAHGASSNAHKHTMAPHVLHWALLQDARACGLAAYDWWGVTPEGAGDYHRLAGVTRFKMGFGGTRVLYPPTCDVVLRPAWYAAYRTVTTLRRR